MVNHILKNDNKILISLMSKLDELEQLNALFKQYLEPELAKHCQVVKLEKNCLFVIVSNGSWATQLRFQIPDLMKKLKTHHPLENLNGIISKTRPSPAKIAKMKSREPIRLTPETAVKILKTAATINDDKLRKILERIASYI